MADTRFTALGLSGSGKTCYVMGMYYEMCVGLNGFNLTTTNETASKLEDWMEILDSETGQGRFPEGTYHAAINNYSFKLYYNNQPIMSFDWVDYGGGLLKNRDKAPEPYKKLGDSIEQSTALYVFIDGNLLTPDDIEKKKNNVKRKCARTINEYILSFAESHNNSLPPIVFVVTKSDQVSISKEELCTILHESFSSIFSEGYTVYAVAVSLGKHIADDDYSGEVEPINIHIPFLLGIYHEFLNYCLYLESEIEKENKKQNLQIALNKGTIAYENSRWFFTNHDRIDQCKKQIEEANGKIKDNQELLKKYKTLLGAIVAELNKNSSVITAFQDGKEVEFSSESVHEI